MKKFTSLFTLQNGSSLVGPIVGAAMLGAVALGAVKMFENMRKGQISSETRMEALELKRTIVSALTDKAHCEASLKGLQPTGDITSLKYANGAVFLEAGKSYGQNRIKVTALSLTNKGDLGNGTNGVDLSVGLEKISKDALMSPRPIYVPLVVKLDTNGLIDTCHAILENTIELACESLGGTYSGGACVLPSCPPGKALRAINPDGTADCFAPFANLSCSEGEFVQGYDQEGNLICVAQGGSQTGGQTGNTPGNTGTPGNSGNTNNPPPANACSGETVQWGQCEVDLPQLDDGQYFHATDVAGPKTGTSVWKCEGGSWQQFGQGKCGTACSPTLYWLDGDTQGRAATSSACTYTSHPTVPGARTGPFDDDNGPYTGHAPHAECDEDGILKIYNPTGQTPWTCAP